MAFYVKRLFAKDRRDAEVEKKLRYRQLLAEDNEIEANLHKRKCLINQYRLERGQIIDYMVDYNDDKFKLGGAGYQEDFGDAYGQEMHLQQPDELAFGWSGAGGAPTSYD